MVTLSNHGYLGCAVWMSRKFWERIPSDLQDGIQEAMTETLVFANQNAIARNRRQLDELGKLKELDISVQTPEERKEWMQAWEPLYANFETVIGRELMKNIRELHRKHGG